MPDDTVARAIEILRETGPQLYSDLAARLEDEGVEIEDDEDLVFQLLESRHVLWLPEEDEHGEGYEDFLVPIEHVLDGAVVTHRVTAHELEHGYLRVDPDLSLIAKDDLLHWAEAGADAEKEWTITMAIDRPELDLPDDAWIVETPAGSLDELSDGDLVGLRWSAPTLELVQGVVPVEGAVVSDAAATLRRAYERLADRSGAAETGPVLTLATVLDPTLFRDPLPPLHDVLPEAGLGVHGEWLAPAGTDWDELFGRRRAQYLGAEHDLDDDAAAALDGLLSAVRGQAPAPSPEDVARHLGRPEIAEAFAVETLPKRERLGAVAELLDAVLGAGSESAGVHWLLAALAEHEGDSQRGKEALDAALRLDPSFGPAVEDAAWYAVDAGEVGRARTLLHSIDSDLDDAGLAWAAALSLPGPSRAGRNEACPCGSGRKHKACCAARGGWSLRDRAPFVLEKARVFARRGAQLDVFEEATLACAGLAYHGEDVTAAARAIADPALADVVLFDGGLLDRFLAARGSLLPDDEAELVGSWLDRRHRVWEITESGEARDARSGESADATLLGGRPVAARSGDHVFAVAAPAPDGTTVFVGEAVWVPETEVDALRELLSHEPELNELAARLGELRSAARETGGPDAAERRAWLFPPDAEWLDGHEHLDPGDEDDMAILVEREHPELRRALDDDADEVVVGGETVNPRLHAAMHQIVANQIWSGDPPETWGTARRLSLLGYDRHEVLHMIGSAVSHQLWHMMSERRPFDLFEFISDLDDLPDSWEEERGRRRQSDQRHHRPPRRRRPHR